MEEKGRKEEDNTKLEEFKSILDKLYDELDEKKLTAQDFDEIEKKMDDTLGKYSNLLSESQKTTFYFMHFPIREDDAVLKKPEWFDAEKFKKGQQFARDHLAALFIGQFYGLMCMLCHESGLEALIMTQRSHTPYLAFKRYLATSECIRNWYKEDVWCKDTQAHKDILMVRKMHLNAKRKLAELEKKELKVTDVMKNIHCPMFQSITYDYSKKLNTNSFLDYWYKKNNERIRISSELKHITQMDMSYTLFSFMGFPLLFPRNFGINKNEEKDLENLCHVWRCIGYLMGVDDRVNLCRGSVKDIISRCQNYIDEFVKPSFKRLKPEWEHMARSFIEGTGYFLSTPSFEIIMLRLGDMLDIQMLTTYSSMTYFERMKYYFIKYIFNYTMKFRFTQYLLNQFLNREIDKALHFDSTKMARLKTMSMLSPLHVSAIDN